MVVKHCPHCGALISGAESRSGLCEACSRAGKSGPTVTAEESDASLQTVGGDATVVLPTDQSLQIMADRDPAAISPGSHPADQTLEVAAPISQPLQTVNAGATGSDFGTGRGAGTVSVDENGGGESSDSTGADAAGTLVLSPSDGAVGDGAESTGEDQQTLVTDGDGLDDQNAVTVELPGQSSSSGDARATAADGTMIVSDGGPDEQMLRTVQSHFGDADDSANPLQTLKGSSVIEKPPGHTTLVIKTRALREVPLPEMGVRSSQAEYELLKVLGEGGMGVVYDARQTSIDRNVALKMLKAGAKGSDKQRQKFLAEAVVTGELDHPNIVPIYDVGRDEQGRLFYSMKKVQGTPWDDVIAERSVEENIDTLMKVADAVAFAHARGVVHRDLKPENTMLGSFGEVLVMDWGLAQPSATFRKSSSITETQTMGGTPAYMAPEMATGPMDRIGPASDVYLLGAMLYEILTGSPPHRGTTAMKCLMAAAKNEIVPTTRTGELIDIAKRAMATDPADRYPSVTAFQAAIREYRSHSESVLLSERADGDLQRAKSTDDYQHYAKALFGFQEAVALWDGNSRAAKGVVEAQWAYADSARRKGDLDLGLSLLNPAVSSHQALREQLLDAQAEREARQRRLTVMKRMAAALAVLVFTTVSVAFVWVRHEKDRAIDAERVASKERDAAQLAQQKESVAKQQALSAKALAEDRRRQAELARMQAEAAQQQEAIARQQAVVAKDQAEFQRQQADVAREQAEAARQKERYEAYVARIGLAAAKIDENAFETARQLLDDCPADLRHWEWGRLHYLSHLSARVKSTPSPLNTLAVSAEGTQWAVGGWDATVRVYQSDWEAPPRELAHGGSEVSAIAFSPNGKLLATGSDDPAAPLQLWDLTTGQSRAVMGPTDDVLSVAFSSDGTRLLAASYDQTARLFDVASGRELRVLRGHSWWVWHASFSKDNTQIVTASQDGTVIVWNAETGERSPPFTGHRGPVYTAQFLPDGSVVSAGYDEHILVWRTDELQPFDFRNLEVDRPVANPQVRQRLSGHTAPVRALQVSEDGQTLVSGGQDNTVRIWHVPSGTLLKTCRGHDGSVRGVQLGRDARTVMSASHDQTVREWNVANYEELRALHGREFAGHTDAVLAAGFSPDGGSIVTASRDRTARTWATSSGALQQEFSEGHGFLASRALFFDEGRSLVTAAVDNTTRLWNVATGTEVLRFDRTGRAAAVAVCTKQPWLITGGHNKDVQVWDRTTGERRQQWLGHVAEVTALAVSIDESVLFSGDANGHVRVWNLSDGTLRQKLEGHSRRIQSLVPLPDGKTLLSASSDQTVATWDWATGQERREAVLKHPDAVLTMVVSSDGQFAVTSCADRTLRRWNLQSHRMEQTFGPVADPAYSLALSADDARVYSAQPEERTVRVWDTSTGRELLQPRDEGPQRARSAKRAMPKSPPEALVERNTSDRENESAIAAENTANNPDNTLGALLDLKQRGGLLWAITLTPLGDLLTVGGNEARLWNRKSGVELMAFRPHAAVAAAQYSPDGRWLVTASWDSSAKVWDVQTGQAVGKLEGVHQGFVNSAVFSADGLQILTASDDGTAQLWNATTRQPVQRFEGHQGRVRQAVFAPDGKRIATAGDDKSIKLWSLQTGECLGTWTGHEWAVLTIQFSPDGQRLVSGSDDNTTKVWRVQNGECERTLAGHTAPVAGVSWSPDGRRIATASHDQTAKIWDALTSQEILTLQHHTSDVTAVTFSPNALQVLTGSRDGTALLWLATDWQQRDEPVDAPIPVVSRRVSPAATAAAVPSR
jgi:WD40 repeat protein/serine/threonine protein kinase